MSQASVIIPGYNCENTVSQCLNALNQQNIDREQYEIIFVDDSSEDNSTKLAAPLVDKVLKTKDGPIGSASSRNAGVELAQSPIIIFIDSDVVVENNTIEMFIKCFHSYPELSSIFGSYNTTPTDPGLVSQYRNLLHHFVHQSSPEKASTFWTGCGAIRTAAFEKIGGFTPGSFMEDIDIGKRMVAAGMQVRLEKTIQVTHLKKWTLSNMVYTDLIMRGIPWMRQLLNEPKQRSEVGQLNLTKSAIFSVPLAWVSVFGILLSPIHLALLIIGIGSLLILGFLNLETLKFFYKTKGTLFTLKVIPLYFLYHFLNGVSAGIAICEHYLKPPNFGQAH